MPTWIVLVVVASIAVTALLTWVLWRINLAALREPSSGAAAPVDDDDD